MSYFLGNRSNNKDIDAFEKIFAQIVPVSLIDSKRRIESGQLSLVNYGVDKVIPDIFIKNDPEGSWLLVLGTPIFNFKTKDRALVFLSDFLDDPAGSMRQSLDGNFAVFAFDARKDVLILSSDFNNSIPIFYSITPNEVLFSSHELPLAKLLQAEIDPFGFSQSIHLGVTWDSTTRFENLYKMIPCELIIIDKNLKVVKKQYWSPQDEKMWDGTFEENLDKWSSWLRETVWKYYECSGKNPVISDFTAGEDSRLILAQCHSLGIPFKAQVAGVGEDIDTIVAKRAAKKIGFDLIVRYRPSITEEQLLNNALGISSNSDAYQDFFKLCSEFAMNIAYPMDDYKTVKYGGLPGGEAFRGSYYLRGKAIFPSARFKFDYRFFTKMKYLLDFHPGLLKYSDDDFLQGIFKIVENNLVDVQDFPIGTQIDHMLRIFQTSFLGLKYKNPLYLPFATNRMTRSIYNLPPRYKKGGKLTKACTELLFPELAFVKTQNGVPTIRKTLFRQHLFIPEYFSTIKKISSGAVSRLFKWTQANKWYYSHDQNVHIYTTLLNKPPYCNWLSSSKDMVTGYMYNAAIINPILEQAKAGSCRYVPILGRIINQELACRWVYNEKIV